MSYEIPKNLKYEEKILFNLSIPQAMWLGIFIIPAAFIFAKATFAPEYKIIIGVLLLFAGTGFAFFDLREKLGTALDFVKNRRELGYFDPRMADFMAIRAIENDSIILKNGFAKAIICVTPINFHILSDKQQEAVATSYKEFLNSIDFPVQIAVRTIELKLANYFSSLEKCMLRSSSSVMLEHFSDLQGFFLSFAAKNSIKNRIFLLVVPAELKYDGKNAENISKQLEIRALVCIEKLARCSLKARRLSNSEIVSLLSGYMGQREIEDPNAYNSSITILEKRLDTLREVKFGHE